MRYEADWLSLREAADRKARDPDLITALAEAMAARSAPLIVDLGCGTGALARALRGRLPQGARWRSVDYDAGHIAQSVAQAPDGGGDEAFLCDLTLSVEAAVAGADCVAASAFYDLVSDAWLDRLIAATPRTAAIYAALTYDGREIWRPAHESDAAVLSAFHDHQRRPGVFGDALGPEAGAVFAEKLTAAGWRVRTAEAWWRLSAEADDDLMAQLADGIAAGAAKMGVDSRPWRAQTRATAAIGHLDILALPRS